jgi:hypothetical protein
MKEVNEATRKSITLMHSKKIIEHCQNAIDKTLATPDARPEIREFSKLANGIRIYCKTEDEANMVSTGVRPSET